MEAIARGAPDERSRKEPTPTEALLEFLEAAVHRILASRRLYPLAVFERRKKYEIPTHMCRHPDVNEWVVQALRAAQPFVESGEAEHIALVILDSDTNDVLESHGFRLGHVSSKPLSDVEYAAVALVCTLS
uniref:HORMA domain-containing protein n=1 Tax=Phaeomonas parva TaxID=124430 RepID=A0A7S1U422_9STRA|mmetsp:Transcript_29434/g.94526  ORF Transcript_29434/g.94526 Transcript_29434/m.94526 type:complete len:131 (+) Transcript_29434:450-842(+)